MVKYDMWGNKLDPNNPITRMTYGLPSNENRDVRRSLGTRDKQILYDRAKGKCEACGKKISYSEMQVGHKTAWSRGGSTTLRNSVCLCYKHNKLQGTDSFATLMRKLGKSKTRTVTSPKRRTRKLKRRSSRGRGGVITTPFNVPPFRFP